MTARGQSGAILVAGGGIGGLASALALAAQGRRVHLLERADQFAEIGAGIQLGPNATRLLQAQGVWQELESARVLPQALHIHDGLSGKRLASVPLGTSQARYGAPYAALLRADLQGALLARVRAEKAITLSTGFEVAQLAQDDTGVRVQASDGRRQRGALLIGADGLHSAVRRHIAPETEPHYSGQTAWRSLLKLSAAPADFGAADIGLWLGPGAHLVHYPVAGGKKLNVVAVIDDDWHEEGWDAAGDKAQLLSHFARWADAPQKLLGAAADWRKWALAELSPLATWQQGRVGLLGDAAHPILPYMAQGAAMAIEDAAHLARALGGEPERENGAEEALAAYARARAPRTARVQGHSKRLGTIYHMAGPLRLARNLVLKARSPAGLLSDLDWLYGTRAEEA